jgi:hypothetical protein
VITTEGGKAVLENLQRKAKAADAMFINLVREMNNAQAHSAESQFTKQMKVPAWLLQTS